MNDTPRDERIRQQAYQIWLDEGCPDGRHKDHWEQAEKIITREDDLGKKDERGTDPAVGPIPGP